MIDIFLELFYLFKKQFLLLSEFLRICGNRLLLGIICVKIVLLFKKLNSELSIGVLVVVQFMKSVDNLLGDAKEFIIGF